MRGEQGREEDPPMLKSSDPGSEGRSGPIPSPRRPEAEDDSAQAWAPYEPDDRHPWNLRRAGHLFRRAAFGARWGELQKALADGPRRTIDLLLHPEGDVDSFQKTHDAYEAASSGSTESLRAWWLRRMIRSPHPLLEKMALFWHGHFAVRASRVRSADLIRQRLQWIRRHALGSLPDLLEASIRDPAMLIGLGAAACRKARPAEHHARVLLERHTVGPDRFTAADVTEVARAMTGRFVIQGELRSIDREHDAGEKAILGRRGTFDGEAAARILACHADTARWVVRRLYRFLVSESEEPGDALVEPLASALRRDGDVARLVETMLRSRLFFSRAAYRQRIKSPVELAVGLVRALEGPISTTKLGLDLARLGQDLLEPPGAGAWAGGESWLDIASSIQRSQLAFDLLGGAKEYEGSLDLAGVASLHDRGSPQETAEFLIDLLLDGDLPAAVRDELLAMLRPAPSGEDAIHRRLRQLAHAAVTLAEFQLA